MPTRPSTFPASDGISKVSVAARGRIRSGGWGSVRAVLVKDLKSEWRTRYGVNAILLFALTTVVAISFAIGQARLEPEILAALLWVAIFFAAMSGLAQVFVKEEEAGTANILKLVATPEMVLIGKLIFNLLLLVAVEAILVPLYFILLSVPGEGFGLFIITIILGTFGLVAATTLIAAIIAKASAKAALFAVLSFPILLPLIITAIAGTRIAFAGGAVADGWEQIRVLISYLVIMVVVSYLLFEFVWYE